MSLGGAQAVVFETPGHTRGHCVYYFKDRCERVESRGAIAEGSCSRACCRSAGARRSLPCELPMHVPELIRFLLAWTHAQRGPLLRRHTLQHGA